MQDGEDPSPPAAGHIYRVAEEAVRTVGRGIHGHAGDFVLRRRLRFTSFHAGVFYCFGDRTNMHREVERRSCEVQHIGADRHPPADRTLRLLDCMFVYLRLYVMVSTYDHASHGVACAPQSHPRFCCRRRVVVKVRDTQGEVRKRPLLMLRTNASGDESRRCAVCMASLCVLIVDLN